jgi:hypothetical protein
MKTTQESSVKENQKSDASQQETLAIGKSLSEGENNSHKDKDSKVSDLSNTNLTNFLGIYDPATVKFNESTTGLEDDNDDEYDDWFQNA